LFVWAMATRDVVCGGELGTRIPRRGPGTREPTPPSPGSAADRIDYSAAFSVADNFETLTRIAVEFAEDVEEPYASLLRLLEDCYPADDGPLLRQQHQGATYRQLAAIAHRAGMSKPQRVRWYRIAESIPLSARHAGHLFARVQKGAA
jgi:hypothetical protein